MSLYKRAGSEIWWVSLSRPGFPRVRESTRQSDRKAAKRRHDILKGELWKAEQPVSGWTWARAVSDWTSTAQRSESEVMSLRKFARLYRDRPVGDVTAESIEEALSFCRTAGTYTRYRTMLMAILNLAKKRGKLAVLPQVSRRSDRKKKRRVWITHAQWLVLLAELPDHMKPMASFAIMTGLRQANVLGLTWDRVDLARGHVWVEAEEMKANAALAVPLSYAAVEVLRGQSGKHVQFVFTFRGQRIREIKGSFIPACVRAGLGNLTYTFGEDGKRRQHYEGFKWHGLRHTWATWHIQNGTPLDVLQKLGGWSDLRMVMNYAHHAPGHLASFANNSGGNKVR